MVRTLSPEWKNLCRQIETQSSNATSVLDTLCEETIDILGETCRCHPSPAPLLKVCSLRRGAR